MRFEVGRVYFLNGLKVSPPKAKYAICICDSHSLFVLINTENRVIYDCIPFPKNGRPFPVHDSYIGCAQIHAAQYHQVKRVLGFILRAEMESIRSKMDSSPTLTPQMRRIILESIDRALESWF